MTAGISIVIHGCDDERNSIAVPVAERHSRLDAVQQALIATLAELGVSAEPGERHERMRSLYIAEDVVRRMF